MLTNQTDRYAHDHEGKTTLVLAAQCSHNVVVDTLLRAYAEHFHYYSDVPRAMLGNKVGNTLLGEHKWRIEEAEGKFMMLACRENNSTVAFGFARPVGNAFPSERVGWSGPHFRIFIAKMF